MENSMNFSQVAPQEQVQGQNRGGGGRDVLLAALATFAILGVLIGIGGISFGIYEKITSTKIETDDLKIKVEKKDGTVVELETDKIKEVSDDGSTITIVDSSSDAKEKYIYLDGYNLGLKIPEDTKLDYVQYEYRRFYGAPNYSHLVLNGVTKKEGAQALPAFVSQGDNDKFIALGVIGICKNDILKNEEYLFPSDCHGDEVFKNGDITIIYNSPQALNASEKDEVEWEKETVEEIKKILSDKNNYIEIE